MGMRQMFAEACSDLPQFRSMLVQACQQAPDEATRQHLGTLLARLDQAFGDAQELMPQVLSDFDSRAQAARSKTASVTQQNSQTQSAIEAARTKLAAADMPKKRPVPRVDPDLGPVLSEELLKRFAYRPPELPPDPDTFGDFWEHWQDDYD